jgi:anti-sigma factor RsiW
MNEHEQAQKKMAALLGGLLPAEEAARLRAHLARCPDCQQQEEVWNKLLGALQRIPETTPTPGLVARLARLATARRQEILERRWNRLVLTGLVVYGWLLFVVVVPLLPTGSVWLGLPWFVTALLGSGLWLSFCWVIALGLLPLFRARRDYGREPVL